MARFMVELEEKDWDTVVDALGFLHGRMEKEEMVVDYYKARFGRNDLMRIYKEVEKAVGKNMG